MSEFLLTKNQIELVRYKDVSVIGSSKSSHFITYLLRDAGHVGILIEPYSIKKFVTYI